MHHYQPPKHKRSKAPIRECLAAGYIPIRHEVARLLIRAIDPEMWLTPDPDVVSPQRFNELINETREACSVPADPAAWFVELSEAVAREFQQAANVGGNPK